MTTQGGHKDTAFLARAAFRFWDSELNQRNGNLATAIGVLVLRDGRPLLPAETFLGEPLHKLSCCPGEVFLDLEQNSEFVVSEPKLEPVGVDVQPGPVEEKVRVRKDKWTRDPDKPFFFL